MSHFWNIYIAIIVLGNILGYSWLLISMRKMPKDDVASGEKREHVYDGIEEYNNPLPRWWMWMFFLCNLFALVYLVLYPGLGSYKGTLGWSQHKQWQEQTQVAEEKYAPLFASFAKIPVPELSQHPHAMKVARRIFINRCSTCHGVNAQGAKGFPNLTTGVWLFGGKPEDLKHTIANGRIGMMPPMGMAIGGDDAVTAVANYVRKISGQTHDKAQADLGEPKFKTICAACHGVTGTGNKFLGAPNLTAGKWIFGGSLEDIEYTIKHGRSAKMPAHKAILGDDKVHLMAAYIYSLSEHKANSEPQKKKTP